MILTPKELAKATTSFETRFRLAYLSVDFDPTVIFACHSQFVIANVYRGMIVKRHFLGAATTGQDALDLVARLMPNVVGIFDDLQDQSAVSVIRQAKILRPAIRPVLFVSKLNRFTDSRECPIVVAEEDVFGLPNTMSLVTMALITNTSYLSPSIENHLRRLDQSPADDYLGTIKLTLRERQLLEAYALGLSNQETAEKLGLSVRSVQTYSVNLLQKLGANNRQRALRKAIALGLTELTHLFDHKQA